MRAEHSAADFESLNNGTATDVTYDTNGEVSAAFLFSGSPASVWVPDSSSLHFSTALTLEAWVKPSQYAGQAILSKWDMYDGLGQKSYNFYLDSGDHVCLTLSGTGDGSDAIVVASSQAVQQGAWTHVAGTFDGTNMTVYINGNQQGSGYWHHTIRQGTHALGIGAVVGGGTQGGLVGGPFYGSIDEASVYSACLSAGDLLAIFNAGSVGKCGAVSVALVNDPSRDAQDQDPTHDKDKNSQSEPTFVLADSGQTIVAAFSDSHLSTPGYGQSFSFSQIAGPRSTSWARSADGGTSFTDLGPLPRSGQLSQWNGDGPNPVMAYDPGYGTVYLLANCSRSTSPDYTWVGFRLWTSADKGVTFNEANTNVPGVLSITNCDRPMIKVDPTTHYLYVAGASVYPGAAGVGVFAARSKTAGASWDASQLLDPGAQLAQWADTVVTPSGVPYVTWVSSAQNGSSYVNKIRYAWLPAGGTSWNSPHDLGVTINSQLSIGVRYPLRFNGDDSGDCFEVLPFPRAAFAAGKIYVVYSDLPPGGSTADQGDIFLVEAAIKGDGSLDTPVQVRLNDKNQDRTLTDQWDPAIAVSPGGTELFIGYYSCQNDPANNSLIMAYGAKVDIANGLAGATFDCFPISQTSFPPLFNGTNAAASLQFDPAYPPGFGLCFDDQYAWVVGLPQGRPPCPNGVDVNYYSFWFQDDSTWADADSSYFYYAWCDRSATWTGTMNFNGQQVNYSRPDADVKLAKVRQ